jgi:hypothetical protein
MKVSNAKENTRTMRTRTRPQLRQVLLLASWLALVSSPAPAQTGMSCHAMGTQDETPPEKLPTPEKLTGIGNVHIKITATPEAQMWFDQGLNLFHDFWDYESARAFEQGVRSDPQCAMCYWGVYLAETFRRSTAKHYAEDALAKADSLKNHMSKSERLYIEASVQVEAALKAAKVSEDKADFSKQVTTYRKLVKHAPHDTQARIFLAEALMDGYDDDGTANKGTKEALALLQGVLKDEPNNSAANHYWIHAVEASPKPEQALHSAQMLGSLAPSSGHMVHMPGHIFYRTGDYASAEKSFTASTAADEHYMQTQHVQVDDDWNYVHNLMYAIANLMEEGKLAEATTLSAKLKDARGQLESTLYPWSPRDSISRLDPRLPVALRTGGWAEALEMLKGSNPPAALSNLVVLQRQLTDFASGMQAVEAHEMAEAEVSSMRLDAELWRLSQELKQADAEKAKMKKESESEAKGAPKMRLMPDASAKPLLDNVSIMSLELRASMLVALKRNEEAKKLFAQAAQQEKDLGYREPPGYIRPVAETEAATLMTAGDWTSAKGAYEKALSERPKSGFPLYGIAMASEKSGDAKAATTQYADFVAAWKDADTNLPQLAHARAYLNEHDHTVASH